MDSLQWVNICAVTMVYGDHSLSKRGGGRGRGSQLLRLLACLGLACTNTKRLAGKKETVANPK